MRGAWPRLPHDVPLAWVATGASLYLLTCAQGVAQSFRDFSLLVLFTGTFLAGLGLQRALLATLVGAVLGCALLGLAGLIGFDRRVPGMVLLRDPLGELGSYAPTALNVAQNLGWAVFELYVMSLAASALSEEVFGFGARWLWVLAFAALTLWLALAGPIARAPLGAAFAVWVVAASMAYLVWWALDGADTGALWSAGGEGGLQFFQGVDLTVAMAAWLPLAADYTRFAQPSRRLLGTGVGYLVPLVLSSASAPCSRSRAGSRIRRRSSRRSRPVGSGALSRCWPRPWTRRTSRS
jgi:purine-cytosine permease-like protein